MEVENSGLERLETSKESKPLNKPEEMDCSEDEGIFLSQKPGSKNVPGADQEKKLSSKNEESDAENKNSSITSLETPTDIPKSALTVSEDSSDDLNFCITSATKPSAVLSDDSDDEVSLNVRANTVKSSSLLDDSDDEVGPNVRAKTVKSSALLDDSDDEVGPNVRAKTVKSSALLDDSDDDLNSSLVVRRRKGAIISDDEEDDDSVSTPVVKKKPELSSDEEEGDIFEKRCRRRPGIDSDSSDSEDGRQKSPSRPPWSPPLSKPAYKYNSDLFDTELSDEDNPKPARPDASDDENTSKKKKEQRPTYKKRENDAKTIHSESQRMVRESELSLPYHKPKQRSLSEFLNRRKKATPPMTMSQRSIKMSMKNLETLRLLEQKKKEVEEFYKSDSDHDEEDPDDKDWKPENECNASKELPVDPVTTCKPSSEETKMDLGSNSEMAEKNGEVPEAKNENSEGFEEDDDLPDLVIERTPKEPQGEMQDSKDLKDDEEGIGENRIADDSGIQSGVSSPLEEMPCEGYPQSPEMLAHEGGSLENDNVMNEKIAGDGDQIMTEKEGNSDKFNADPRENKQEKCKEDELKEDSAMSETFGLEKAVKDVSLETKLHPKDAAVPSTSSELTGKTPRMGTPKLHKFASRLPNLDMEKIAMATPKLSLGGKDDFIDLDDDVQTTPKNVEGIHDLLSRFVKHSSTVKKPAKKQQVNLSVVSKEKDAEGKEQLVSSNLVVNLEGEEEKLPGEPVPGARMKLLKTALQKKIIERREKERQRRVKEKQFLETEQVSKDYYDDGALPNEEEEFMEESESEYETESEPEENDVIMTDKKRKKSAYVDDEAEDEEEDDDDVDGNDLINSDVNDDGEDSDDTVDLNDQGSNNGDADENDVDDEGDRFKLQWEDTQDIKAMRLSTEGIANSSVLSTPDLFASQSIRKESLDKDSMDSSFEMFGSVIPAHQPEGGLKRKQSDVQSESENEVGFLTPFNRTKSSLFDTSRDRDLTLPIENTQDLFNTSASASISAGPSPCPVNLHLTPLEDSQFPLGSDKSNDNPAVKLKLDFTGVENSQDQDDELVGLCTGNFSAPLDDSSSKIKDLCSDDLPPTQDINDLMGLCSGQFTTQPGDESSREFKMPAEFSNLGGAHEKTRDTAEEDEELLELCSGRFTAQSNKDDSISTFSEVMSHKDHDQDTMEEDRAGSRSATEPQMIVDSSDDDDDDDKKQRWRIKKLKKRRRILAFSDDEDAQDAVEYDDEENEIPRTTFTGFKDKFKGGIRADFLDKEAELSESDNAVSDDEYEGEDLDVLEQEEGDLEHYDENELRDQVGRAHLKSLLDSDKRELRLLQEMYLEDGELHGEGRQRQFRWKNVDADDGNDDNRRMSDAEDIEEEENEDAAWRKERFEREKFLKAQQEKGEVETEAEIFKVSNKTLLRSSSMKVNVTPQREPLKEANPHPVNEASVSDRSMATNPYSIMRKRGSFLGRDKDTLARIAEFTKEKGSVVGAAKQSGNFVFQQLSAEEVKEKEESGKRVNRSQSLPSAKRVKVDRSFFSMDMSSQSSSIFSQML